MDNDTDHTIPARHWLLTALATLTETLATTQYIDDVISIHVAPYSGRIEVHLRPAAWSELAKGRAITWDATVGHAHSKFSDGRLDFSAMWTRDELAAVAPDVVARVFPPPAPRSIMTDTWSPR